jgi:D-beta-D-heptose 7-phosphate kinase/D-beta-D-heptose 1-phosphate adenosyltransferase
MPIDKWDYQKLIKGTSEKGCLVVGDVILDKYTSGDVSRISPEAPIPVLRAKSERFVLGGAANVAGNVCGYHVRTFLAGIVGNDIYGEEIKNILMEKHIQYIGVESKERRTTIKSRVIAMNQQLVRVDYEDASDILKEEADKLLENIGKIVNQIAVVVLSDYNKGICTEYFCKKLISLCKKNRVSVIVDPKSVDWTKYMGAALITPNFKEFREAFGQNLENTETAIQDAGQMLLDKYGMERILVTRSQYGMTFIEKAQTPLTYQAMQQEVFDVSGAGDTVIGSIAALLTEGFAYDKAIEISNYAAGLSVSKSGTYVVTAEEVINYINRNGAGYQDKIIPRENIGSLADDWKKQGGKIVFTNGCFDILHVGHVEYLNKARALGNKMIVGLNSDESVKRLKGDDRPVNPQNARAEMLAALQCIDAVVIFDEDTPENLVKEIRPDFLVKGGDYKIEEIVGRQYAGEVRTIPLTEGFSTTGIIAKISGSRKGD